MLILVVTYRGGGGGGWLWWNVGVGSKAHKKVKVTLKMLKK